MKPLILAIVMTIVASLPANAETTGDKNYSVSDLAKDLADLHLSIRPADKSKPPEPEKESPAPVLYPLGPGVKVYKKANDDQGWKMINTDDAATYAVDNNLIWSSPNNTSKWNIGDYFADQASTMVKKSYEDAVNKAMAIKEKLDKNPHFYAESFSIELSVPPSLTFDFKFRQTSPVSRQRK